MSCYGDPSDLNDFPHCNQPPERHARRMEMHHASGRELKESIERFDISSLNSVKLMVDPPREIPMSNNPQWANEPFGAVGTLESSGCLVFATKVLLEMCGEHGLSTLEIANMVVERGYRMWKLANSNVTMNSPHVTLVDIQHSYPEDNYDMQSCTSLEEVYSKFGKPVGIGSSAFFLDNLIAHFARKAVSIYNSTRIWKIEEIFICLGHGRPVPMRVNNGIYHNDSNKRGGHYVNLIGFDHGSAVMVDSSEHSTKGIYELPIERLFKALTADSTHISAWNSAVL